MKQRQNTVDIFSTFYAFETDIAGRWLQDTKLYRSMQQVMQQHIEAEVAVARASKQFWAVYWHQVWQDQRSPIAFNHLSAYLQEACYWAARKVAQGFRDTQFQLSDYFQMIAANIEPILRGFDSTYSANLEGYAKPSFLRQIRDVLRQQRQLDICSDAALLRKVSRKKFREALVAQGLSIDVIECYQLAWTCFKDVCVPDGTTDSRQLAQTATTWVQVASLYNREAKTVLGPRDTSTLPTASEIERWLKDCATALRRYLFPRVASLNTPKSGDMPGELLDDLAAGQQTSLLADLLQAEAVQQRQSQREQLNQVLRTELQQLEPALQELLRLYYGEALTQQELAESLQIQQYTVSRKLSSIKKKLLKALALWSQQVGMAANPTLTAADQVKQLTGVLEDWLRQTYQQSG
ncbi:MAG: sigma-70 family RNA polymerase sigma factor [Cyanobacteria bacterium P01_H01_bin.121]